jgi:hypothetical protein
MHLVVEMQAENGRENNSANAIGITLYQSLHDEIERLRSMVTKNNLVSVEGSITADGPVLAFLDVTDMQLFNMPCHLEDKPYEELQSKFAAKATSPKVRVTKEGAVFTAYDKYASEPTLLESELIPFRYL